MEAKKHIITIAGGPGSGKSSAAKGVARALGYTHFSSGDLFRQLAKEQGVDLLSANLSAEQNTELDNAVDGRLQEINETGSDLVIDSRTAWHWISSSFKVFLQLDLNTAARRILAKVDDERSTSEKIDPTQYVESLKSRLDSENRRYKTLYNIDPYKLDNYHLIIDTTNTSPEEVVQKIVQAYHDWLAV